MKSPKSQVQSPKSKIPREHPAKSDDSFLRLGTLLFLIPYALYLSFCGNDVKPKQKPGHLQFKQALEKVNKYEVQKQSDEINRYILHRNWAMKTTGTGLRYIIIKEGKGLRPEPGDFVRVNYKISLLDGTPCYSSEKEGPKEFKVEGDNVESGMHEAVLLMRMGGKAKFILPSYMAHGVRGDEDKIPPLSAIVVDLELLEIY